MQAQKQEVITCPYCWEGVEILVDLTSGNQEYVEDCQVCCNPILISVRVEGESFNIDAQKKNY